MFPQLFNFFRAIVIDYSEMTAAVVLAYFKQSRIKDFFKKWLFIQHSLPTGAVTR
jgi:hypothetical protein